MRTGRRPRTGSLVVGLLAAGIGAAAALSALTGNDRPLEEPPPLPTTAATTAPLEDAPLAAAPVGALDLLPGVPADRARDVVVIYDSRCDAYMLHLDRPRELLLVDLPVPRSCLAGWSPDGAFAADAGEGLVIRDRAARTARVLAPRERFQRGSAAVDERGAVVACQADGTPVAVPPGGAVEALTGVCPVVRIRGATVVAASTSGPLVTTRGDAYAGSSPVAGDLVALAASPRGRLHAQLENDGGSASLQVLAPSSLPVAAIELRGEVAMRDMTVAPRIAVADDGELAVATVRQRAHVLRLGRRRVDLDVLGAEPFIDAALSPDGRSIAVATGRRVVVLDADTLDPVGQVPIEALRVVWLDRARLG